MTPTTPITTAIATVAAKPRPTFKPNVRFRDIGHRSFDGPPRRIRS